jgi:hypothetical protein
MYQAAKTTHKRLLVLPGQFNGFHGWQVLTNVGGVLLRRPLRSWSSSPPAPAADDLHGSMPYMASSLP